ncbi:hypothetical protein D3C77_794480 [compost metagenome]
MQTETSSQGSGLGLLIVDMLLKEMKLRREIDSTTHGTSIYIYPLPPEVSTKFKQVTSVALNSSL